jgi:hypothetical protein
MAETATEGYAGPVRIILTALFLSAAAAAAAAWGPPPVTPPAPEPAEKAAPVRFDADVQPILSRCRPCHYPGGVMYARMPFDDEATVRKAGEKLFTRVKDEKQQAVLRHFFAAAH